MFPGGSGPSQDQGPPSPQGTGQGPGPGGGFASPAPPVSDPRAAQTTETIMQMLAGSRRIGLMSPATVPEVRALQDALSRIMAKIKSAGPTTEPQAPPV